jgi:hypothetical protein
VARRTQGEAKSNRKLTGWSVPPGPTIMEHTEEKLRKAVRQFRKAEKAYVAAEQHGETLDILQAQSRADKARGVVRGLAIAVLAHRNSYYLDDKSKLLAIEKEFMNDGD